MDNEESTLSFSSIQFLTNKTPITIQKQEKKDVYRLDFQADVSKRNKGKKERQIMNVVSILCVQKRIENENLCDADLTNPIPFCAKTESCSSEK